MSLAFPISFGLAQLETCTCKQSDYCSCRSWWPLLSFIFVLPDLHKDAISQGPWGECSFSFLLLTSVLGRSIFAAEACCSIPAPKQQPLHSFRLVQHEEVCSSFRMTWCFLFLHTGRMNDTSFYWNQKGGCWPLCWTSLSILPMRVSACSLDWVNNMPLIQDFSR